MDDPSPRSGSQAAASSNASAAASPAEGADATRPTAPRPNARLRRMATLAWPTMLSRAGILVMALVDIVMVGRYSSEELAYAAIGMSLFVPILVTGIGLLLGAAILTAQSYGRGDLLECGRIWRRALAWGLTLGAGGAVICAMGETWLILLGQTPALAAGGGAVAAAVAIGLPAQLLYAACAFHLEATQRPMPVLIAMVAANLVNIALNWVLIYGNLGAPELGAVGSAIATSLVRVFMFLSLFYWILRSRAAAEYGLDGGLALFRRDGAGFWGPGGWRAAHPMRRLGAAAGTSYGIETSAYAILIAFAGWFGELTLAAYSISHNLEATLFMVALGVSTATAAMVGAAVGRGDPAEAEATGWLGVRLVLGVMAAAALIVWLGVDWIVAGYTPDPEVRAAAAPLVALAAFVAILDGAQIVMGQAVRALGDAWAATRLYVVSFLFVMIPTGYLLAHPLGFGAEGLVISVGVGCATAFALQAMRFRKLCRAARAAHAAAGAPT